jgi:hypothetical protein
MAEDVRTKIRTQITHSVKDQLSRKLIQNWAHLRFLTPELPEKPPTATEMMGEPTAAEGSDAQLGIAGQLLSKRKARIGSVTLDVKELDAKLEAKKKEGLPPHITTMLNTMGKIDDQLPTETALNEVTEATASGIDSQSGTFNKIWSFIKAIGKWLFSAISSIFGGGKMISFSEALAQSAAPGVGDAVRQNLQTLASNPSKASHKMLNLVDAKGRSTVDTITDQITSATYTELGATPPPSQEAAPIPLDKVVPTDIDIGGIRSMITQQLLNPAGQPPLTEQIKSELNTNRDKAVNNNPWYLGGSLGAGMVAPGDAALTKTSRNIANTVANTIATWANDKSANDAIMKTLNDRRESISGVNLDEEAANMVKFQQLLRLQQQQYGFKTVELTYVVFVIK